MPDPHPIDWYEYPVAPVRLRLLEVHFSDNEEVSDADCVAFALEPDLYERLLLSRPSLMEVSVALEISAAEGAPLFLRVAYAADFELHRDLPADAREKALTYTAHYLAPRTIYPYLREFIANLTKRWRGGEITLPYFPIPTRPIEEGKLEIPPPPEREEYQQTEFPLTGKGRDERTGTNV